jgi:aspartyl-tRNA(Asn)/glutamyl-tRNA(Gln) amidotransferase subunit C
LAIERATIIHIARLANLEFSEEEVRVLSVQLNEILGYVEKLNELNIGAIQPTSHVTTGDPAFRDDRVGPSLPVEEALANAPESREGHFAVPKVIG